MNKLKHTPGPWKDTAFLNIIASDYTGVICQIDTVRPMEEDKANAKLIAAAPEMLDIIIREYLLNKRDLCTVCPNKPNWCKKCIFTKYKSTIEKATGKKIEDIIKERE